MKVLLVCGQHQYGDPSRGVGTEYAAFAPALARLGHQLVHFESWNRACHQDFAELNRRLLDTVRAERPAAMLVVQMNYEIWLETLLAIKALGNVATLCWTTDDSWKYEQASRFLGPAFHAITTTYPEVVPKYHRDGIPHVLLTQWAASSEHLREPLPASACKYPATFVGAAHGNRRARIERLRSAGVAVECFGHGWPAGSVAADDIPRIMRESVVSLNFANSQGANQIKARTFEVPGAGGCLLTERAPHLADWYRPGTEIEVFDDDLELAAKARYLLDHPAERDALARAGFERTRAQHIYELRLQQALDFACGQLNACRTASPVAVEDFPRIAQRHSLNAPLRLLRRALVTGCSLVWGPQRGPRAARRLTFELSWRLFGKSALSAVGWTGRMFPDQ